jgi:hypothetical protein
MSLFSSLPTHIFAAPPAGCSNGFFGLPPWYKYLPMEIDKTGACVIGQNFQLLGNGSNSGLLLIGLAIIEILLRIAGLVAFAFVVYGGALYITSQGEPQAVSKAKSTIINALIGLVIALIATGLVVFVGRTLAG